jgi:3-hydroxyisobutyrate dehydrogenase-like beta-hydroxyacid dehydrogenase
VSHPTDPDPDPVPLRVGILGYGEVGHGLALGLGESGLAGIVAYQREPGRALTQERVRMSGVRIVDSPTDLARSADLIIAATQGSQSLAAARSIAGALGPGHRYLDLASATPKMKRDVESVLAPSGARFADGAIEGSPLEHGHRVPVIASGPGAGEIARTLGRWGMQIAVVGPDTGTASGIKTLRHVLMKGQIALLIECAVAARRCGIDEELFRSVARWYDDLPFMTNANRLLRTTTVHARRRAEEAAMACAMLEDLGVEPVMTRSTVDLLSRVEALGLREQLGARLPESAEAAIALLDGYAHGPGPDRRSR